MSYIYMTLMCAKHCVESEILSCLQPDKLTCFYFPHASRRQEIPGSETKGVITHDNSIRQFCVGFHGELTPQVSQG